MKAPPPPAQTRPMQQALVKPRPGPPFSIFSMASMALPDPGSAPTTVLVINISISSMMLVVADVAYLLTIFAIRVLSKPPPHHSHICQLLSSSPLWNDLSKNQTIMIMSNLLRLVRCTLLYIAQAMNASLLLLLSVLSPALTTCTKSPAAGPLVSHHISTTRATAVPAYTTAHSHTHTICKDINPSVGTVGGTKQLGSNSHIRPKADCCCSCCCCSGYTILQNPVAHRDHRGLNHPGCLCGAI